MRFLIDADLPRACVELLESHGHEAVHVADLGLAAAPDSAVAERARSEGRVLLTGDFDFANVRDFPPERHAGIVVMVLRPESTRSTVLTLLGEFLAQSAVLAATHGRLTILERGRVRMYPRLAP